jgi:hypothetical protein
MEHSELILVVYDPPQEDLPFLSVVFVPGTEEPMVTPFNSAAEAEAFNQQIALKLESEMESNAED